MCLGDADGVGDVLQGLSPGATQFCNLGTDAHDDLPWLTSRTESTGAARCQQHLTTTALTNDTIVVIYI
jgi:hypothetical protein